MQRWPHACIRATRCRRERLPRGSNVAQEPKYPSSHTYDTRRDRMWQSQVSSSSHDCAVKELDTGRHTVLSHETLVLQIVLTAHKLSSESQCPSPNKVQHTCRKSALARNSVPIPPPPTPAAQARLIRIFLPADYVAGDPQLDSSRTACGCCNDCPTYRGPPSRIKNSQSDLCSRPADCL